MKCGWVNGKFKRMPTGTIRYRYRRRVKRRKTRVPLTLDDLDKIFDAHFRGFIKNER